MKRSPAEHDLVSLVVDAARRRRRGEPVPDRSRDAARLIIEVGAQDDGIERFFALLARELEVNSLPMPSFDELPDAIAPFATMFGAAIVTDDEGHIDMEATAAELDATSERAFGTSPRKLREAAFEAQIRREISESVAESLRQHGLTPVADMPDDGQDDE